MKTCTKCKVEKPLEKFPPNKNLRDGRHSWCLACCRNASRKTRATPEGRAKANATALTWQKNNPGKHRARAMRRKAAKLQRTLAGADQELIGLHYLWAQWYTEQTGVPHHVDHVIPLQGDLVSGLHVETNLQVVPAEFNHSKGNKFDVNTFDNWL